MHEQRARLVCDPSSFSSVFEMTERSRHGAGVYRTAGRLVAGEALVADLMSTSPGRPYLRVLSRFGFARELGGLPASRMRGSLSPRLLARVPKALRGVRGVRM